MTNDTRTPDEIERDSADERARLSSTINEFQKKFSVDSILHDVGDMFRGQNGGLTRTISRTVSQNPAAVALIGAGVAWLLIGQGRNDGGSRAEDGTSSGRNDGQKERWNAPKRQARPGSNRPSRDGDRFWFSDDTSAAEARFDKWNEERGEMTDPARQSPYAGGQPGDTPPPNSASLRDKATALTDRLLAGTEGFSEEAKARVLAVRRAAHDARMAADAAVRRSKQAAGNLFDDQPLVVGALALAVGAAIGGALPRTRIEDDQMGASSDQLFAEAQAVFHEERAKAMDVLKAAGGEAKDAVQKTAAELAELLPDGKSAGAVIASHLSSAATRVLDGAKQEAAHQNSGTEQTPN